MKAISFSTLGLLSMVVLSGCASSVKNLDIANAGVSAVGVEEANVILIRKNQWHAAATGARLKIDGSALGYMSSGRHIFVKTAPGNRTLEVDVKASFGTCKTQVEVKDSEPVYVEVKRMGAVAGLFFGGVIGNDIAGAIESERPDCGGVFQINEISKEEAIVLMQDTQLGVFETGSLTNF